MHAVSWKSGLSAPRRVYRICSGFRPRGRIAHPPGVFPQPARLHRLIAFLRKAKSPPLAERATCAVKGDDGYDPFWQTGRDSPWKVTQSFTVVHGGTPKYGSVPRSYKL